MKLIIVINFNNTQYLKHNTILIFIFKGVLYLNGLCGNQRDFYWLLYLKGLLNVSL